MIRRLAVAALVIAALAALAALLWPADAGAKTSAPQPAHSASAAILGAAAPAGTDALTPAQEVAALDTAHRVCEGYAALVPHHVMTATLAADSGLSPEQAEAFIVVAHRELCPTL